MGGAIAKALLLEAKNSITVGAPRAPHLSVSASQKKRLSWLTDNREVARKAEVVIIAVKPNLAEEVLRELAPELKKQLVISVAAGLTLASMVKWSGGYKRIVRTIPNLPAQVLEGLTVWKAAAGVTQADKKKTAAVLASFGGEIEVKRERMIDWAVVSGSSPAFVAAFMESLARVAVKGGFSQKQARQLALQSVFGATCYIAKTGVDFGELKKAVQTKGGATEAAFKVLNDKKWQQALESGLIAAKNRCQQMGK